MDSAFDKVDAAGFLQIWQHFDVDDNGYIEGKELDAFFRDMLRKLGKQREEVTEFEVRRLRESFMSAYDASADGRLQIHELANMILPDDENFLLLFRRETPLDNSVEFMRDHVITNVQKEAIGECHKFVNRVTKKFVADSFIQSDLQVLYDMTAGRIWRTYDVDSSGYISAVELKGFLRGLFLQHRKTVSDEKLEEYTDTMMKMFDKNKDGRLDLNDLARILALKENFLLKFKLDACSQEDRRRDFEKIFAHYDVSKTGALEGPEVDGFVKDMMELVKPSISGVDLERFRTALLGHCDINQDGKIQRNELALCLGLKLG